MNQTSISILVPVYKAEDYLTNCIESVLLQDFTDYELILVDDESPDKSGAICDEYTTKYPDKIKTIHKKNGGHNSARLTGLKNASGKYIMFLDSDDFLLPNSLSILYNKITEGYDIVKGSNNRVYKNNYSIETYPSTNKSIENSQLYLTSLLQYKIPPYLWGGLYKKDLFTTNIFNKVQNLSVSEDWIINLLIWKNVKRYIQIENVVYSYYINPNSIMQTKVTSFSYIKRMYLIIEKELSSELLYNEQIKAIFQTAKINSFIKSLFSPEIRWDNATYDEIIDSLSEKEIHNKTKEQIDKKFILFISHKYIFKTYCCVYKILYKKIRLKGAKREVIY